MVVVEVFLSPKVVIGCVYVPPSCSDSYRSDVLSTLHSMSFSCDYIICVDFNAPENNWASLTGSTLFSNLLCDLVFSKNLIQLVSDPTIVKVIVWISCCQALRVGSIVCILIRAVTCLLPITFLCLQVSQHKTIL